jgi:hypothetical protein
VTAASVAVDPLEERARRRWLSLLGRAASETPPPPTDAQAQRLASSSRGREGPVPTPGEVQVECDCGWQPGVPLCVHLETALSVLAMQVQVDPFLLWRWRHLDMERPGGLRPHTRVRTGARVRLARRRRPASQARPVPGRTLSDFGFEPVEADAAPAPSPPTPWQRQPRLFERLGPPPRPRGADEDARPLERIWTEMRDMCQRLLRPPRRPRA